jgi:hypothetical protein
MRHFPDDREVDQSITSYTFDGNDASPVLDQLKAAAFDSVNRFRTNAPGVVATGLADRYLEVPDPDRSKIRGAIRQMMAALSAGVLPLCPHVQRIRPLIRVCDPPVVCCAGCLPSRCAIIEALGRRWDHQCDRCGVHVEKLTPLTIGGLGHITVDGHVCRSCASDGQRIAIQHADQVLVVGNRRRRRGGAR